MALKEFCGVAKTLPQCNGDAIRVRRRNRAIDAIVPTRFRPPGRASRAAYLAMTLQEAANAIIGTKRGNASIRVSQARISG